MQGAEPSYSGRFFMSIQAEGDYIEFNRIKGKMAADPVLKKKSIGHSVRSHVQGFDQMPEETSEFLPENLGMDSQFQIHFSILKNESPTMIVLHCSGNMVGTNCLILHN